MKQLKMFLMLLLTSFILSGFSNVKAEEFTSVTGTGSSYYKSNSQFVSNYNFTNQGSIEIPAGQYFKFNSVKMTQSNLLPCNGSTLIYRVDFILWGWHNQNKTFQDWINYSQKITLNSGTYTFLKPKLLGSIVQPENGYRIKVSTFVSYNMLEEKDCGSGLNFDLIVNLLFNDSPNDKYFLDTRPGTENSTSLYYSIENIYNVSSTEEVNALLTSYYSGNQITQEKLDNISSSIDNVTDKIGQTNEKLDAITSTLTDTSSPDLGGLSNSSTWLPQGPVDSIIMLPLNFINTLVSKIGSTCSPVNLPIPFVDNKYLTLPCISTIFAQIDNFSILYDLIGVIGSVYLLYNYLLKFYKWVDDTLSFRENNWQDWGGD